MKTLFFSFLITCMVILSSVTQAQQTWLKTERGVQLYSIGDKVGIGTIPMVEKVAIKSLGIESQLGLYGYSGQNLPFLRIYSDRKLPLFDVYAGSGWWSFGSMDTAAAKIYYKGSRMIIPWIISAKSAIQRSYQQVDSAKTTIAAGTYLVGVNSGNLRVDSISLANIPLYSEVTVTRLSGSQNVVVYCPSATINGAGNLAISSSNAGKRFFKKTASVIWAY